MESKPWLKEPSIAKQYLEEIKGKHFYTKEPILHSHVSDLLDDDHPLAFKHISCDGDACSELPALLHSSNNECMQTWIETEFGNFCTKCWKLVEHTQTLEDNLER